MELLKKYIVLLSSIFNTSNQTNHVQHDYKNERIYHISCIYHVNVNVNLMEVNVIQVNGGITINVDTNVKNIIYVKKIIFGILLHAAVKMESI